MGEPKSRRHRHGASHQDSDEVSQDGSGSRYGDHDGARGAAHAAEERVRVLEQYIKDMSIQNMQRMQASNGADNSKWEKELKKKDDEIAKLKALVVSQGNELSEAKKGLETLKKENSAMRDQFEIGCRRLAYHTTRFINENTKWDMTGSSTSTMSTVSTLSLTHSSSNSVSSGKTDETEDFPKVQAQDKGADQGEMDHVPLRAEDTADYCSFPSSETLGEDSLEFMRRLRSDLRRIALADSVKLGARDVFTIGQRSGSSDSLLAGEPDARGSAKEQDEVLKGVEERIGRVQAEMRGLYTKLGSMPDVHLIDPVQIIQTTSTSLTRMLHDVDQITPPVRDMLASSKKVVAESAPMSRRLRLAESDLKIKEQRHALKVELLEKRLGRLTSTLTSVQQETWSSRRGDDKSVEEAIRAALHEQDGAALANLPVAEYKQFLELLSDREREVRRAERQAAVTAQRAEQLEQQVVDLAMAKFDAECATSQAKAEEEFWSARSKEMEAALSVKSSPTASPTIPGTSPGSLLEGLLAAPPAFCMQGQEAQVQQALASMGLPPTPAFAMPGMGGYGGAGPTPPPPPFYQTIFPYLGQGLTASPEE